MSEQDPMTVAERRKYIHKVWGRYIKAERSQKTRLLDEMCKVTGMHRKSILRIINGKLSRTKRTKQRGKVYGVEVDDAIRVISRSLDYPCAERLQPNLRWMADHLAAHGSLVVSDLVKEKLEEISVSTLKRVLKRIGRSEPKIAYRAHRKPKTNSLRKGYPMTRIDWDEKIPGRFEVDLVHHGGKTSAGEYIHTLQIVDVATGWCEITAIFGRSNRVMRDGFSFLLDRLPFPATELHPDNGAEFFNHPLLQFLEQDHPAVRITRSRPYQKNDNRFVEENNASLIRAYVGYDRFDTRAHLRLLRKLYDKLYIYHNFFLPVRRLVAKQFISSTSVRKVFDKAIPPFDRLMASDILPADIISHLSNTRSQIDPLVLRDEIDSLLAALLALPALDDSDIVDIFQTFLKGDDSSVTLSNDLSFDLR